MKKRIPARIVFRKAEMNIFKTFVAGPRVVVNNAAKRVSPLVARERPKMMCSTFSKQFSFVTCHAQTVSTVVSLAAVLAISFFYLPLFAYLAPQPHALTVNFDRPLNDYVYGDPAKIFIQSRKDTYAMLFFISGRNGRINQLFPSEDGDMTVKSGRTVVIEHYRNMRICVDDYAKDRLVSVAIDCGMPNSEQLAKKLLAASANADATTLEEEIQRLKRLAPGAVEEHSQRTPVAARP